jgi:hypothetical protein
VRSVVVIGILTFCTTFANAQDVSSFAPGAWNETTANSYHAVPGEEPLQRFKKQAIQSVSLSGGWLVGNDNDLNSQFAEVSVGLGVPLGSLDNILGVTPSFRVDWIDAAPGIDVPSELYEVGVQFFFRKEINQRWNMMAIVRPAIRSDFTTDDQAFRIFGLGLLTKNCIPDYLSVSFGAVFLDRADLPLLPAIGLRWTPRTDTRLDLRFPESRLSHRLQKNGSQSETWAYLSAGLGGNTWAVTRESGETDELSLRDIRLTVGLEKLVDGGGGWFAEAGYAFKRCLEYESGDEIEFSDGVLFSAGWSY